MATVDSLSRISSAVVSSAAADVLRHDEGNVAGGYARLDGGGLLPWSIMPTRLVTLTDGSSVTPDAGSGQNIVAKWTNATATPVLNAPSSGVDGQVLSVHVLASGAIRVITQTGFIASTDFATAAVTVASGKWAVLTYVYVSAIGWMTAGKLFQA